MGFINEYVNVRIGKNGNHYKNKGYTFDDNCNKNNTFINVKITDLSEKSHIKFDYQCDLCGKIIHQLPYSNYNIHNHNGNYYCVHCSAKLYRSGKNHYKYDDNKSDLVREQERKTPEYAIFQKTVLQRDNYKCQLCQCNTIYVHHLDGWNWCEDKRYDISNGVSLCELHHKAFHSKYGYGNNTREQFLEFIDGLELNINNFEFLNTRKRVFHFESNTIFDNYDVAAKKLNMSATSIQEVCCGKTQSSMHQHFKYYDDYIKMTQEDISTYISKPMRYKLDNRIVLLNTRDVGSIKYMSDKYHISSRVIRHILLKEQKYTRQLYNGLPMIFVYYEDYINMSDKYIDTLLHDHLMPKNTTTVCITTGNIFLNIDDARKFANLKDKDPIYVCCKHKRNITYAGKLSNGTKLQWIYWKEFILLPLDKQRKILELNPNNNINELLEYSSFLLSKNGKEDNLLCS